MPIRVRLDDLSRETWEEVADLTVADDQRDLIASNLYSIAESHFLPGFVTRAVTHDERAVGFAMYGPDPDDGQMWLYRLMIDKDHQGKGLGRAALQQVIAHVRDEFDAPVLRLGVRTDNVAAKALYTSAGFVPTGQVFGDEDILELRLSATD
ncbi:GNAT family N-acetyltransferase [Microtetraspora fusca]|uniref:GNAT family N-acetyltransferase n=1 Tax=Microtetraspora fusca TaxID=1997 RepID=A0ABW6V0T5_MICFU|nr:GNAT family N-acetyltransferase [Microtetraspora fusca]